jgi:hypothetical protein
VRRELKKLKNFRKKRGTEMLLSDCDTHLKDVASAFGAILKADRLNAYHEVFQEVTEQDWKNICQKAKVTCERFPSIKELCVFAYEIGAFGKRNFISDWQPFDCVCGASFVFSIKQAKAHPEGKIECPNKITLKCNRSYDLGYLLSRPLLDNVPLCKGCDRRHFPNIECLENEIALNWIYDAFHGKEKSFV